MNAANIFKPYLLKIEQVIDETPDVKTLRLVFVDEQEGKNFSFRTGQFGEYSVFGAGECTFCIASPPTRSGYIECTFRKAGRVTSALANLEPGETIGFRGPYGNIFPISDWKGKNLLFIAGGIALPPMRSVIWNVLDLREHYGDITIVYGARSVADLVYKRELAEWGKRPDIKLVTTVDPGGETSEWKGEIGFVPAVLDKVAPANSDTVAVVCGPPVMIKSRYWPDWASPRKIFSPPWKTA
jgi:sulfhydrogenase subunit gamma (sulfur reductase)